MNDKKCEKHQTASEDAARDQKIEMLKPLQHDETNLPSIKDQGCGCDSGLKDRKEFEREE